MNFENVKKNSIWPQKALKYSLYSFMFYHSVSQMSALEIFPRVPQSLEWKNAYVKLNIQNNNQIILPDM